MMVTKVKDETPGRPGVGPGGSRALTTSATPYGDFPMKSAKRVALEKELGDANRRVFELRAQLASAAGNAFDALPKASDFHASAVILHITALGGREVVAPVAIRDGLSQKAVEALQEDLRRSFELATMVSPAMARP